MSEPGQRDGGDLGGRAGADGSREGSDLQAGTHPELARLRDSIDNMDAAIIYLLAERFKVTQRVGYLKAELALPPADPAREAEQIQRLRRLAEQAHLDPEFAEKFLNFIVREVVRNHQAIAQGQE